MVVMIDREIQDLVPRFLAGRERDLRSLREGLARQDFPAIRRTGHMLRGIGGSYGFDAITDLGGAIEAAAARQDAPVVKMLIERLHGFLAALDVVYV